MMQANAIWHWLAVLVLFQLKHFVCDGPLQSNAMVLAKSRYGAKLGVLHALIHGVGTALILILSGFAAPVIALYALADFVLHYHIDFVKENLVKQMGWTTSDGPFWWAISADQMLHHLTYLGIVAWLVTV